MSLKNSIFQREDETIESKFPESVENLYRHIYFKALCLTVCGIKECFNQSGYKVYSNLGGKSSQEVRRIKMKNSKMYS